MKSRNLLLITLFIASLTAACGSGTETPTNSGNTANTNSATANAAKANSGNAVAVTTPTPDQVTNAAPTLTPVFKAYCAAMVKKDEAAVRKFWSKDTLKNFEEQMKDEGIKSLSEFLKDDGITNEVCEVSNERIVGDQAVGKIKTKAYPNGFDVLFVKEDGDWKLTNRDAAALK